MPPPGFEPEAWHTKDQSASHLATRPPRAPVEKNGYGGKTGKKTASIACRYFIVLPRTRCFRVFIGSMLKIRHFLTKISMRVESRQRKQLKNGRFVLNLPAAITCGNQLQTA
ncbi:hypothetical protein CDAR_275641 [Caerostris darwini]|uniref:Uncharacterized protein n=1 Tax=Caerostris darwini TaxID=1538125 RepID=A0AAV4UML2_9ARAC|nr:hypothetical protein CDAR_275641 [Caerostris darwini]